VKSTITKLPDEAQRLSASLDPTWRVQLGIELRRVRRSRGLTQGSLGDPLSKGFVSAVEHGLIVPSLPALRLMTDRLGLSLADFFTAVDRGSTRQRGSTGS
jgi:transcriptional regulator with XRE-family HTH domain